MTPETAQAIVDGVASRHPKFKPLLVQVGAVGSKVTFEEPTVDPRRVGIWFEQAGCTVSHIGYNVATDEWCIFIRKMEATS